METAYPAYGLWGLVIINSAVFIIFAYSFVKPKTRLDWRSLGAFSSFIVALFAEMYGFLLMWPTVLTLAMYPVLIFVYYRLTKQEERLVRAELGGVYDEYAARVPAFIPRRGTNLSSGNT